jgi:uncharacterized membrane protein (UPF0127 family)
MTREVVLDTALARMRGVIGRRVDPGDRFIFEFDEVAPRMIHMVGVRVPLRVEWWIGDELVEVADLRPWTGLGRVRADRVVEIVEERDVSP